MSELSAFNRYCKANGINANGQLAVEDLVPAFHAGYVARQDELRTKVAELEAQLDYYRGLEPVAYYDPQERGFYWAKPTKIEAPVTVKVAPIPLYALEKMK